MRSNTDRSFKQLNRLARLRRRQATRKGAKRERIKKKTIAKRRLHYQRHAA